MKSGLLRSTDSGCNTRNVSNFVRVRTSGPGNCWHNAGQRQKRNDERESGERKEEMADGIELTFEFGTFEETKMCVMAKCVYLRRETPKREEAK